MVSLLASVLTIAFFGSRINAEMKDVPIALVMLDEGTTLPSGVQINLGQKLAETVTSSDSGQDSQTFQWTILSSEEAAMDAMNNQKYYGVLVIPKEFSEQVMSVMSTDQNPGEIAVYINSGMSTTVANILTQVIGTMETGINKNLKAQLTAQMTSAAQQTAGTGQIPSDQTSQEAVAQAAMLHQAQVQIMQNLQQSTLVNFTVSNVNPVPEHSANGNAPVSVIMLAWMIGLISSVLLYFLIKKEWPAKMSDWALLIVAQSVCAIVFCIIAFLFVLLVGHGLLKLTIPNSFEFCLYFTLISFSFFLMQSMVINWFGVGGNVVVLLVFFFCMPLLSLPYEMLSSASKFWLYSWMPLRFGVDAMRDFFYFANTNITKPLTTLLSAGGICLAISFLSLFKPVKIKKTSNP